MVSVGTKKNFVFPLGKRFVGSKLGKLYLRKTYSNIFLTFTDYYDKVIACVSSGSAGIFGSKRLKNVSQALEPIVRNMSEILKQYGITHIYLILTMSINSFYYTLVRELEYYGFRIRRLLVKRKIAFNGVKGRKLRRK